MPKLRASIVSATGCVSRSGWASAFTVSYTWPKTTSNPASPPSTAHHHREPYERERDVYARLSEAGVRALLGFHVPQLIRSDDELLVIEMTIVTRPFVLDFAGAYLGAPPHFSEEIWEDWEAQKREQFDQGWPKVQAVLAALEELDIYMVDVSPSNIAFVN